MAVSNTIYTPTEDLILAKPRRRFHTGVRWQHWQLRSLIGIDGQNVVLPTSGPENRSCYVLRLNTKTRETEAVKRLSFMPRCLVARNGWVCCGGELGIFSAFRVGEESAPDDTDRSPDLQGDDRLPLSLDLSETTSSLLAQARSEKNLHAQSTGFGKDRVNCITLWLPPTLVEPFEGAYDQDVAVLAHNDSSVIVVSLRDQEALDKVTYPDYMNRGVLSPDGRLLIAISDDPFLYVHERKEKKPESGSCRAADRPTYEWKFSHKIQLKSQRQDDRSDNRGSFAACFSSTGRYLAVGTQYGTISIFNTADLGVPGVDPLFTSFKSSRANAEFGSVRDMAFSPGPGDLLAWTEDRGRVGIADVRAGFDTQQILYLDRDDDFDQLPVIDRGIVDPRLLEPRSGDRSETLLSSFASALESSAEGRQTRTSEGQGPWTRYNIPLTPEETAVLEAIQDFRRRQDQYGAASTSRTGTENGSGSNSNNASGNGSGTGARPPWAERAARSVDGVRTRERTASVSRAVNEILDNIRDQRERMRDSQERLRTREDNTAERRRYAANPFSGHGSALGTAGSGTSGRGALISRLMSNTANPPSGSWDNVEALYDDPLPSGNQPHDHASARIIDFRAFANSIRRARATYLMREWEESPTRRFLGTFTASHSRPRPYDTAGLSWSEDGETLFVGAENGIFEFHVNSFGRRFSPSITFS